MISAGTTAPTSASSSFEPQVKSLPYEGVLELGKRLLAQLELGRSTDILARWMAHRIAELIDAADKAPLDERELLSSKCASAILDLWRHRHELPDGSRPFGQLEPVLRALASLDPEATQPRFRVEFPDRVADGLEDEGARDFLRLALDVDSMARTVIRHLVLEAVGSANVPTAEWVSLAQAAGLGASEDVYAIRIIIERLGGISDPTGTEKRRQELIERRKRLVGWQQFVGGLVAFIDGELEALARPE